MADDPRLQAFITGLTRRAALLVVARMRELEEKVEEPGRRWEILRKALERFGRGRTTTCRGDSS